MYFLRNKGGKIVCFDSKEEYERYLGEGFTTVTKKERESFIEKRVTLAGEVSVRNEVEVKTEKNVYFLTVSGGADGYGVASRKLLAGLPKVGVEVSTYYEDQKVGVLFHNPYSLLKMETPYRIVYTMFESTKIPADWGDYLKDADKVIVPSKWCSDVFKKSGVEAIVIPLGYDPSVFKYYERMNKRKARKDYVFLHYNAFNARKGFLELFKAFTEEFKHDEPVKLILKTNLRQIPVPIVKSRYPNIEVIQDEYSEKQLVDLIKKSDCFVFPSRGEGFGMTPLECMATGMPAIVPNAHGITEYFNNDYMLEVKVKETCPALYSRYKGQDVGEMVVCDVKHLRQQMRYIYEHQDEGLKIGRLASEYVKKWTIDNTCTKLKGIIDEGIASPIERKVKNILQLKEVK